MAAQTARIINMINLRGKGKVLKNDTGSEECLVFAWGKKKVGKTTKAEMTEEMMTEFDRNMSVWGRVKPHG